jgi:hypothetical protein
VIHSVRSVLSLVRTRLRNIFLFSLFCLIGVQADAHSGASICEDVLRVARPGDIVYIQRRNYLNYILFKIMNSHATHPSLILEKDGKLMVAESITPVSRWTDLCEFVNSGHKGLFSVKRVRGLEVSRELSLAMTKAADRRMGVPYDLSFKLSSKKQFCSKFVYEVYKETTGIQVGKLQNFRELLAQYKTNSPTAVSLLEVVIRAFNRGEVPWDEDTIAPASQYFDSNLELVIEHPDFMTNS